MAFTWSEQEIEQNKGMQASERALADARRNYYGAVQRSLGVVPKELRRITEFGSYSRLAHAHALRWLGETFECELKRSRNWQGVAVEKRFYDHHLTHAATACFTSPYQSAMCAVVDGAGEGRACTCYSYFDGELTELKSATVQPGFGSLGWFYWHLCEACGFLAEGGEQWKVMGLSAYGALAQKQYDLLKKFVTVDQISLVNWRAEAAPDLLREFDEVSRKPGSSALTAADLAFAGQRVFEEALFELLSNLHRLGSSENLVLVGGCALNSLANGKIIHHTPFQDLYVPSAPADDGNAIGAALLAFQQDHPDWKPPRKYLSPYLGSRMKAEKIDHFQRFANLGKMRRCDGEAPMLAARFLAEGRIVGWIQGRAEFGPRALGNRSILADARKAEMKDILNARVKFREEFRPFAPAILHEYGAEYFHDYQESRYMERTLQFRSGVIHRIPSAVHKDGTGRLQTLKREWNVLFYDLVTDFHRLTGIPLVINTSYNVMGKPIVHSMEDTIAVFFTSGIDVLFVEDLLIEK